MPLSYNPYDYRMQSDNYLTNLRNGQANAYEQNYLQEEQMRLQNALLRQRMPTWSDATDQAGPSYATGPKGGKISSTGGYGEQDMLPEVNAPRYLSNDQTIPGGIPFMGSAQATPDSLRGTNQIQMSIAPTSAELASAPTYARTLTDNPEYEAQRQARMQEEMNRLEVQHPGLPMTRLNVAGRKEAKFLEGETALDKQYLAGKAAVVGDAGRADLDKTYEQIKAQRRDPSGFGGRSAIPTAASDVQVDVGPKVGDKIPVGEDGGSPVFGTVLSIDADGTPVVDVNGKKFRARNQ